MPPRRVEVGSAELEVLKVLWDEGPMTVRQVHGRLGDRGRRVAYTTVLTFLTRLESKGCVTSDKSGPAYVYRAAMSRRKLSRSRIQSLLRDLYDNAAGSLVLQLVRSERLTEDEVAQLQQLLSELDSGPKRSNGPERRRT